MMYTILNIIRNETFNSLVIKPKYQIIWTWIFSFRTEYLHVELKFMRALYKKTIVIITILKKRQNQLILNT